MLDEQDVDKSKMVILEFTINMPERDFVTMQIVMTAIDKPAFDFFDDFSSYWANLPADKFKIEPLFYSENFDENDPNYKLLTKNSCHPQLKTLC